METAEDGQVAFSLLVHGHKNSIPAPGLPSPSDLTTVAVKAEAKRLENSYSLTFLDNQMPRLSGVELSRRLRRLERR